MSKINDLTNKRFGRLLVLKYFDSDKHGNARWLCKCDCGNEKVINRITLISGGTQSCGCLRSELASQRVSGDKCPLARPDVIAKRTGDLSPMKRPEIALKASIIRRRKYVNELIKTNEKNVIYPSIYKAWVSKNQLIKSFLTKNFLFYEYITLDKTVIEISSETRISVTTIYAYLEKYNIPIKSYTREKSHCWKGGIAHKPYCEKWTPELHERIRSYFNYECVLCGKPQNENLTKTNRVIKLHCHHVYYNKQACCNDEPVHFAALCINCHMKTGHNRERWQEIICRIINEIYNGKSYYTKEEYAILFP